MVCYYHPDRPAVGLCKHCQRGLCTECAAVIEDSLACSGRHEQQVKEIQDLFQRSQIQLKRLGPTYLRNAVFYFLVGVLFTGFGIYQVRWTGLQGLFLVFIGLFLLYAAGLNFAESRKYR